MQHYPEYLTVSIGYVDSVIHQGSFRRGSAWKRRSDYWKALCQNSGGTLTKKLRRRVCASLSPHFQIRPGATVTNEIIRLFNLFTRYFTKGEILQMRIIRLYVFWSRRKVVIELFKDRELNIVSATTALHVVFGEKKSQRFFLKYMWKKPALNN